MRAATRSAKPFWLIGNSTRSSGNTVGHLIWAAQNKNQWAQSWRKKAAQRRHAIPHTVRQRQSSILGELCLHPCGKAWPCVCVCVCPFVSVCVCVRVMCVHHKVERYKQKSPDKRPQRNSCATWHTCKLPSHNAQQPHPESALAQGRSSPRKRRSLAKAQHYSRWHTCKLPSHNAQQPHPESALAQGRSSPRKRRSLAKAQHYSRWHTCKLPSHNAQQPHPESALAQGRSSPKKRRSLAKAQHQSSWHSQAQHELYGLCFPKD